MAAPGEYFKVLDEMTLPQPNPYALRPTPTPTPTSTPTYTPYTPPVPLLLTITQEGEYFECSMNPIYPCTPLPLPLGATS